MAISSWRSDVLLIGLLCLFACLFHLGASGNLGPSVESCTVAICADDCSIYVFPAEYPIYSTLQRAADNMPAICHGSRPRMLLAPGADFSAPLLLPAIFDRLEIDTFTSPNTSITTERAKVGSITSEATKYLHLRLTSVNWVPSPSPASLSSSCLTISAKPRTSIFIRASKVSCSLSSSQISELQVNGSSIDCTTHTGCDPMNITLHRGTAVFAYSSFATATSFALLNVSTLSISSTSLAQALVVFMETSSTLILDYSTLHGEFNVSTTGSLPTTPVPNVLVSENEFLAHANIIGDNLALLMMANRFLGNGTNVSERSEQNLFLFATCSATGELNRNAFGSGTFFIGIPSPTQIRASSCPQNTNSSPYTRLDISTNKFVANTLDTSIWEPAMAPSASIVFSRSFQLPRTSYTNSVIDLSRNWWGDASGPFLCCNVKGRGGYPTQMMKPDFWCLDESCNSFSTQSLSTQCITSCCPHRLERSAFIVMIVLAVLVTLALTLCLIFIIISLKRRFHMMLFTNGRQEEMLQMISNILYVSLGAASLSSIVMAAIVLIIFQSNSDAPLAPRQERIQIAATVPLLVFWYMEAVQVIVAAVLAAALLLRKKFPNFLRRSAWIIFGFHSLLVAYIGVLCLIWIPFSLISPTSCSVAKKLGVDALSSAAQLSEPSFIPSFLSLCLVPTGLLFVCIILPSQMLNTLLYNFEYASITVSIENALLLELAKDMECSRRAYILRCFAFANLACSTAVFSLCVVPLAYNFRTPDFGLLVNLWIWDSPRWIAQLGTSALGMLTSLALIRVSFAYHRVAVLSALLATLTVYLLGGSPNVFCSMVLLLPLDPTTFRFNLALTVFQTVATIVGIFTFIVLWKFRSIILRELPSISINNLNAHLDGLWSQTSPAGAQRSTFISTLGSDTWTRIHGENDTINGEEDSVALLSDIEGES